MDLFVNNIITLKPIDKENAALLFPLFKADLKEISRWFPFDDDYRLEYDLAYIDEKKPPFDETFVVYYKDTVCGRVGLYDYDEINNEIFVYYWIATPFRRNHIAINSLLSVVAYLKTLDVKTVLFEVKRENSESLALLNKLPEVTTVSADEKTITYSLIL